MGFLLDNFHCTYLQYTSNPFIYFDLNFWQFALNVQIRSFFHEIYFQSLERVTTEANDSRNLFIPRDGWSAASTI